MAAEVRKFRRRPDEVEAFRLMPEIYDMPEVWPAWARYNLKRGNACLWRVPTIDGNAIARPGSWIVRGPLGDLYPVLHEVFIATHDPID